MMGADEQSRIRSAILMHSRWTPREFSALRDFTRLSDSAIRHVEAASSALERAHKLCRQPAASWRLDKGATYLLRPAVWISLLISRIRTAQAQREMLEAQVYIGAYVELVQARMDQLAFFASLDQVATAQQAGGERGATDNG